jgi:hypothetical protein
MEATCSSEMLVDFQRTTPNYIPEDRTIHNHQCENLKSYIFTQYFGKVITYEGTSLFIPVTLHVLRMVRSRRLKQNGQMARMGETENPYRSFMSKPLGKYPFGRPRRRWEDNIKKDLKKGVRIGGG